MVVWSRRDIYGLAGTNVIYPIVHKRDYEGQIMSNDEIREVKSRLSPELAKKFDEIKDERGVTTDAELFRILITEEYKRLVKAQHS